MQQCRCLLLLIAVVEILFAILSDERSFVFANQSPSQLTYQHEISSYDLKSQADETERKHANLIVLGFVTPWNAKGKDVALSQASHKRLDITSTVSWQMHPDGLAGGHDFDDSFYKKLSELGSSVYPRVLFEKWSLQDFRKLSESPEPLSQRLVQLCQKGNFDGVVIEIWQSLLAVGALQGAHIATFLKLVKTLGEGVRKDTGLHTVLVLPPYTGIDSTGGLSEKDFEELKVGFSYFVIMTYDFSVPGSRQGPMAPIKWVSTVGKFFAQDCGLGRKVLLGLNFYGLDFLMRNEDQASDDRHVLGSEYISLLQKHNPKLVWIEDVGEHAFRYSSRDQNRVVFYPTRQSVALRVETAERLGCGGVAIWELGQGLDHFFGEF